MGFPVRRGFDIQCYCDGEKLGEKTTQEWADEIGAKKQTVAAAKCKGNGVRGADGRTYHFYALGVIPPLPKPAVSVVGMDTICKAEHKTYGELQTEVIKGRVITPEDVENAKQSLRAVETPYIEERTEGMEIIEDAGKTAEIAAEAPARTFEHLTLTGFAKMADETTICVEHITADETSWLLTAPSDSPVFDALAGWHVDSFRADFIDGAPVIKVVVR